ncbi:hypothetical protein OUZ56_018314 [Daphnia magna]|uniref:Uncharacterized protein n=1 Tax=Daphnia magna TaxID=35525 RepID=A0ABQ9Z9M1_9CRUS|nr:hypothetical protein OUZ56_018314 [Daphnia magna]
MGGGATVEKEEEDGKKKLGCHDPFLRTRMISIDVTQRFRSLCESCMFTLPTFFSRGKSNNKEPKKIRRREKERIAYIGPKDEMTRKMWVIWMEFAFGKTQFTSLDEAQHNPATYHRLTGSLQRTADVVWHE